MKKTLSVACVQLHWARTIDYYSERTARYIREAAAAGCRVALFPEASLTGYDLPAVVRLRPERVVAALDAACAEAKRHRIWAIVGSFRKAADRWLNLAHVISPAGRVVHEYAKVHMAGREEQRYCRGGDKLSLFEIDGVPCTLVICRDGRHPELYRIPAMAARAFCFIPPVIPMKSRQYGGNGRRAARNSRPGQTRTFFTASPTRSANRPTGGRHRAADPSSEIPAVCPWPRRDSIGKR